MDLPNHRSSHTVPTPRAGGLAIVLAMALVEIVYLLRGLVELAFAVCFVAQLVVAMIGLLDDRSPLPPAVRLIVHLGAAFAVLFGLGGLPAFAIGDRLIELGWWGYGFGALSLVWVLNLFNFMDGIDGIAASEAAFVAGAGGALFWAAGGSDLLTAACMVFAAACLGFLVWNWPPARIFMGDVGSGFLGISIGTLAVAATREHAQALWVWLILGGAFVTDATMTFLRRAMRRERLAVAHRTHAYQWLARRWGSHQRVTLFVLGINVLWLLPWAWFANHNPQLAVWSAGAALVPLALGALVAGSGRPEH
jgi:Fuc2NAc and GlcNAc transferase